MMWCTTMKNKRNFWRIIIMCVLINFAIFICLGFFQEDQFINPTSLHIKKRNFSIDLQLQEKRATYLTVQTKVSPGWCRMQASALLSGISVVSLGFGENYSHTIRPLWILQYITKNNLDDSHVLVFMDGSDTFFTSGDTMRQAVTKFINTTAATADQFDSKAVMDGKATAPLLFGAEEDCWGADIWYSGCINATLCENTYFRLFKKSIFSFSLKYNNKKGWNFTSYHYLNAGMFISRVWAFKIAVNIFYARLATREGLFCDQSIWTSVFLDSGIENFCSSKKMCALPGMISLDFQHNYFIYPYGTTFLEKSYRPWNQSTIHNFMSTRSPPFPHFFDLADNRDATPGVIHFPGWRKTFPDDISRFLPATAWVQESHRDRYSINRSTEYLRNTASVKVFCTDGKKRLLMYGDVCSADDAMDKNWLGKVAPKR